jgi:hypothetical protein
MCYFFHAKIFFSDIFRSYEHGSSMFGAIFSVAQAHCFVKANSFYFEGGCFLDCSTMWFGRSLLAFQRFLL